MMNNRLDDPTFLRFDPFAISYWPLASSETLASFPVKLSSYMASATQAYLAFLGRRVLADLEFMSAIPRCRTAPEFWQTYSTFWIRAADDYQREFADWTNRHRALVFDNSPAYATTVKETESRRRRPISAA
jgi:hypothetical protein